SYPDEMSGGPGDDYLSGGNDGDTYSFNPGDGHDTIDDRQTDILVQADDVLVFGAGILPADVNLSRQGNSSDLQITFDGSSDSIDILKQFEATDTGPFGVVWLNRIEQFVFADGTIWTPSQIMERLVSEAAT